MTTSINPTLPSPDHRTPETIAVIGLGYVGLPVAVALAATPHDVIAFDINADRVDELRQGLDRTGELTSAELLDHDILWTCQPSQIAAATAYIICVPTPVTDAAIPDFRPLESAGNLIGPILTVGDLVVLESTVYPGATEEILVPLLEEQSGLRAFHDFEIGYSPERINPGDARHTLKDVIKVVAANTDATLSRMRAIYGLIVTAGLHEAPSIKVGEAAKVIENTQRDLNIALINELAMIFHRLDLDTEAVLAAAGSKWNFHNYKPGLVGGHCIGVDPYYLTYKAQQIGHSPDVILAGRRINDRMGEHAARQAIQALLTAPVPMSPPAKILIMGFAFKENCGDIRNTGVAALVRALAGFGAEVDIVDPRVDPEEVHHEYGLQLLDEPRRDHYDMVIVAVPHPEFMELGADAIRTHCHKDGLIFDLKYAFDRSASDLRL